MLARVDRLEKRAAISGGAPSPAPVREDPAPPAEQHPVEPVVEPETTAPVVEPAPHTPDVEPEIRSDIRLEPPPSAPVPTAAAGLSLVEVRRLWPDIVEATKLRRRVAWMHLTQNSQVVGVDGATLTLGFANAGARESFVNGGCDEILRQAAIDVAGVDWLVETIVDPGASSSAAAASTPVPAPAPREPASASESTGDASAAAREAIRSTREVGSADATDADPRAQADADAHRDDPDADTTGLAGPELLQRELGAEVIEEIRHS